MECAKKKLVHLDVKYAPSPRGFLLNNALRLPTASAATASLFIRGLADNSVGNFGHQAYSEEAYLQGILMLPCYYSRTQYKHDHIHTQKKKKKNSKFYLRTNLISALPNLKMNDVPHFSTVWALPSCLGSNERRLGLWRDDISTLTTSPRNTWHLTDSIQWVLWYFMSCLLSVFLSVVGWSWKYQCRDFSVALDSFVFKTLLTNSRVLLRRARMDQFMHCYTYRM